MKYITLLELSNLTITIFFIRMKDRERIKEEIKIAINRRLNLLNGELFNLEEETKGLTNEILLIIGLKN